MKRRTRPSPTRTRGAAPVKASVKKSVATFGLKPSVLKGIAKVNWSIKGLPIHRDALARDAAELLAALDRVRSYRAFLAHARAAKAAGRAPEIDRQVLAQARVVQTDSATATAAAARVMRTLHTGGAFTQVATAMNKSLKGTGPLKARDLWTHVRHEACRPCLERSGVSDAMLEEFDGVLAQADLTLASDGPGVMVRGTIGGKSVRARMAARKPATGLPRDPLALLSAGRFLGLCDALERGEPGYLLGTGPRREPFSLEDVLMADALAGQREAVRHTRKLEDVGLATHAGGEPATIVGILIAVAIIGAIIVAAECDEDNNADNDPQGACLVGILLLTLGTAILLGMMFDNKQQQLNTLGGQQISGPLPQLEGQSA